MLELLIVMGLLSVFAVLVGQIFTLAFKAWTVDSNRADMRVAAGLGLERMERDIMQAENITVARADRMTFTADVDDDGTDETVVLLFNPDTRTITRRVNGRLTNKVPYIQDFALSYYKANADTDFTPQSQGDRNAIRFIDILLTANKGDETLSMGSGVCPRNQGL